MPIISRNTDQAQQAEGLQAIQQQQQQLLAQQQGQRTFGRQLPAMPPMQPGNPNAQRHNHELLGSTLFAEMGNDRHNHRFAVVTGPAIPVEGGHVHYVEFTTDFYDHHHSFAGFTELQTVVDGKHVHQVKGITSIVDEHAHAFNVATLVESPATTSLPMLPDFGNCCC